METTVQKRNLAKEEEKEFNEYLQEKTPQISKLLSKFPGDAQLLKVFVEKFEKHNAYQVELSLSLPSKNLVAKETRHTITEAMDLAKDQLIDQIKKHMAHLRKDRQHQSIRKEELVPEYSEVI